MRVDRCAVVIVAVAVAVVPRLRLDPRAEERIRLLEQVPGHRIVRCRLGEIGAYRPRRVPPGAAKQLLDNMNRSPFLSGVEISRDRENHPCATGNVRPLAYLDERTRVQVLHPIAPGRDLLGSFIPFKPVAGGPDEERRIGRKPHVTGNEVPAFAIERRAGRYCGDGVANLMEHLLE